MYYLSAIYDDDKTRLGTHANRIFRGGDINRVIQNFKKMWYNTTDRGNRIIGVEVEYCLRSYAPGDKKRIYFGSGSEKFWRS